MAKLSFKSFQKQKIKTFLETHFFSWYLTDFSKKTWNIVKRNTFHSSMLAFLENGLTLVRRCMANLPYKK